MEPFTPACLGRLAVAAAVAAAPFAAALAAAAFASTLPRPRASLPQSAGPWLRAHVARARLDRRLRVGVTPDVAGGQNAYWPHSDYIGLSASTWEGRTVHDYAIAAHELGHALGCMTRSWRRRLAPTARVATAISHQVLTASLLVVVLYGTDWAPMLGFIALCIGLVGSLAIVEEELAASRTAADLMAEEPRLAGHLRAARAAWIGGAMAYVAPAITRMCLLVWWWPVVELVRLGDVAPPTSINLASCAVLTLAPLMLLRAIQVVLDAARPVPIRSAFRLSWTMDRERSWELQTGMIVVLWVVLSAGGIGEDLAVLALLALLPAVGPVSSIVAGVLTLPIALVTARRRRTPTVRADDPMVLVTPPGPALRALSMMRITYLPLLGVLLARSMA